jgi:head-tail adaptor
MKIGSLDTPARIEQKLETPNTDFGGSDISWVAYIAKTFIELSDITTRMQEETNSDLRQMKRPCRVRMRYFPDLNSTMRIVILDRSDRILEIVSKPAELGRKEGLEMMCHDYEAT